MKSNMSYYDSSMQRYTFLPSKPPLSRFLQCLGFNLASPKLVGNAAVQGARPRSCGRTLCPSTTPPSTARRPASTSTSPWARVAAVAGFIYFSFSHCSAATHAQCGHMSIWKSLLLRKSIERPSRLTHSSGIYWAKKPRQRLPQLLSLSFNSRKGIC